MQPDLRPNPWSPQQNLFVCFPVSWGGRLMKSTSLRSSFSDGIERMHGSQPSYRLDKNELLVCL